MMARENVTFIVQGPLHPVGIAAIPNYLKLGKVIVSSWVDQDLSLLKPVINDVTVILNRNELGIKRYDRDGLVDNDGNIYYQCISTLTGLKNVDTKYVIKVRGDESFDDWTTFFSMMKTGKIVSSNRFARHHSQPFHLGDTLFGGETQRLFSGFVILKDGLSAKVFHTLNVLGQVKILSAEQKIYMSILKSFNWHINFEIQEPVDIMKEHFLICPLSAMGNFLINSSGWARDGLPNPRAEFNSREWGCIDSIDQI